MSCPIFVIKTEDGTERLLLVDDNGVGNAIPTGQNFGDLDIRQDYVSGDEGKNPVRLPHEFVMSMDYVNQEIREKLLDWKYRRVRVTLAEQVLFGESTIFAYTPVDITGDDGGAATDLTGTYVIAAVGDAQRFGYWDHEKRVMEEPRLDNQAVIMDTKFGPAYLGTRKALNRAPNPYPEAVTAGFGAGKSGWKYGDTTSSLVVTHIPDGFDNTLCPDTLQITTDGSAGAIQLWCSDYFDTGHVDYGGWVPPAGSTTWVSIWVKGQFPTDSNFKIGPTTKTADEIDLSTLDLSEWTRVDLGSYETGAMTDFLVQLNCNLDALEFCNFQIGPVLITTEDDSTEDGAAFGGPGHFTDQTVEATGDATIPCHMTAKSFEPGPDGTATIFYSVPEDSPLNTNDYLRLNVGFFYMQYITGTGWDGMVSANQRNSMWTVRVVVGSGSSEYFDMDASVLWSPGLHSLTMVWGGPAVRILVDGVEQTPVDGTLGYSPVAGDMAFNGFTEGPFTGCSVRYHGLTVQNKRLQASEVSGLHSVMADTISRNLVETVRGRLYEIVDVPSTVLIQDGFTRWLGDITLRQVKYTGQGPAWFAEDVY